MLEEENKTVGINNPLITQPSETPVTTDPLMEFALSTKIATVESDITYGSGIPYAFNVDIKTSTPNQLDNPNVDLVKRYYFQDKKVDVGFIGGMEHSWFAQSLQKSFSDNHVILGDQFVPSEEQIEKIFIESGRNADIADAVLFGATSWKDVEDRLKLSKEQQEYRAAEASEGLSFDMVLSAIGGGVTDPLAYVPIVGWGGATTRLAGRVITGAVMGATSNQLENYVSGTEADLMTDMAVGAGFGLAIEGALRGVGVPTSFLGNSYRRSVAIRNAELKGESVDARFFEGYGGSHNLAGKINDLRVSLEKRLPALSIAGLQNKAQSKGLVNFLNSVAGYEGGRMRQVQPDGSVVYLKYASGKETAEEMFNRRRDDYWKLQNDNVSDESVLIKKGYSREELSTEAISFVETGEVHNSKLLAEPEFVEVTKRYKGFYKNSLEELKARDLISEDVQYGGNLGYVPVRFSMNKVADFLDKVGGINHEQRVINGIVKVKGLLLKTLDDKKYRVALKKYHKKALEEGNTKETNFRKWIEKKAEQDAKGYLDQSKSKTKGLWDDDPSVPVSQYHDRTPWKLNIRDEDSFSINDLRSSVQESTASYSRRLTGDLVAYDAHGAKSFEELSTKLDKLATEEGVINTSGRPVDNVTKEAQSVLRAYTRALYQMAKNDQTYNESMLSAVSDSIKNLTFFTKNAFMGLLNYTETAEGVKAYGASFVIRSIPGVNKLVSNWTKGTISNKEAQGVLDLLFGSEVQQLSLFRDIKDSALTRFHGDKFKAALVGGTQWLANSSPLTQFLQSSQTHIVGAAQGLFLADLIRFSHGLPLKQTGKKLGFINKKTLSRLNIDEDDFKYLQDKLKNTFSVDKKGKVSIGDINSLKNDPRAMLSLRRLGDYVGDEVIQRKSLSSVYVWNGANTSPIMDLVMQFKSFALDSYNKRLVKMMNRVEEGEHLSQFLTMSISTGLATIGNTGFMALKVQGMTEEQKAKYYEREFGVKSLDELEDNDLLFQLAMKGLGRTGTLAAPMLLANTFGIGTGSKTTGDIGYTSDDEWDGKLGLSMPSADYLLRSMLPAYSSIMGTGTGIVKGLEYGYSKLSDAYTPYEQEKLKNSFYNSWRAFTPNLPYVQNSLINLMKDETPTFGGIK